MKPTEKITKMDRHTEVAQRVVGTAWLVDSGMGADRKSFMNIERGRERGAA